MTLSQEQQLFARRVPYLLLKAFEMGYEVTGGDWNRDQRCPYGSRKSKHFKRLAIDLNLFKDGEYLQMTKDHKPLGTWWKSIGGVWGGDFNDGNHYQTARSPENWMPIEDVANQFAMGNATPKRYTYLLECYSPLSVEELK